MTDTKLKGWRKFLVILFGMAANLAIGFGLDPELVNTLAPAVTSLAVAGLACLGWVDSAEAKALKEQALAELEKQKREAELKEIPKPVTTVLNTEG